MLSQQAVSAAMAVEKQMYLALTEVEELTGELGHALERRDQVAVRMYLSLRQEEINRLTEHKALLRRQCAQLPEEEARQLRALLSRQDTGPIEGTEDLKRQVKRNGVLLDRVLRADKRISQRLGGKQSFYQGR